MFNEWYDADKDTRLVSLGTREREWQGALLADLLAGDPILDAYPDIGQVKVFVSSLEKGVDGVRDENANRILVSNRLTPEEKYSVLVHEIQHVIQEQEGLAKGGDYFSLKPDDYWNTSGEVESRNVQKRLNMTAEERAATPPWETEDVPEDKQIIRFKRSAAELQRDYDEVVRRYTNADGTKKRGWMRAPNGKPTRLTERQWVQVRTPAFKEWFGDWEANAELNAARDLALNGSPVSIITGQEFQKDPSGKNSLVDRVSSYFDEIGGKAESPILGMVELNRRGVKSSIAHGIGPGKAAAFAAVKDVIEKGVVFDRNDNWKGRGHGTAVIAAPIRIGNNDYVCELVVNRYADRNAFYLHEVYLREKLSDTIKTATGAVSIEESARPVRSIIAQRLSENNPASKVLDERN